VGARDALEDGLSRLNARDVRLVLLVRAAAQRRQAGLAADVLLDVVEHAFHPFAGALPGAVRVRRLRDDAAGGWLRACRMVRWR
jgi:hypothetical protein